MSVKLETCLSTAACSSLHADPREINKEAREMKERKLIPLQSPG